MLESNGNWAGTFVGSTALGLSTPLAMLSGFAVTLVLRGSAILFGIELGEPGQWWKSAKQRAAEQAAEAAKQDAAKRNEKDEN
jgi:hypothetical protein